MKKERGGKKREYIKFLEVRLSGLFVESALLNFPLSSHKSWKRICVNMGVGLGMDMDQS